MATLSASCLEQQLNLLKEHGKDLSPKALEILAKNLKNNVEDKKIIDILLDIYNYDNSTFFTKSAVVSILGSFTDNEKVLSKIKNIAADTKKLTASDQQGSRNFRASSQLLRIY